MTDVEVQVWFLVVDEPRQAQPERGLLHPVAQLRQLPQPPGDQRAQVLHREVRGRRRVADGQGSDMHVPARCLTEPESGVHTGHPRHGARVGLGARARWRFGGNVRCASEWRNSGHRGSWRQRRTCGHRLIPDIGVDVGGRAQHSRGPGGVGYAVGVQAIGQTAMGAGRRRRRRTLARRRGLRLRCPRAAGTAQHRGQDHRDSQSPHPTCRVSRADRCGTRPPSASTRSSTYARSPPRRCRTDVWPHRPGRRTCCVQGRR